MKCVGPAGHAAVGFLIAGSAWAGPGVGADGPVPTVGAARPAVNVPTRIAGIHRNADGTYRLTTPWYPYRGGGNMNDSLELCFDALQCDDAGVPIGGAECGLPGDGYRYYSAQARVPYSAEDMTLDKKFMGAKATGASFLYWWTDNGTGTYWYIAVFTMEGFGHGCADDYTGGEPVYDGIVQAFNPLATGLWYTPLFNLDFYGLFFQMPLDGDGGYIFILADAFDGQNLTIAANPASPGSYGTSEDGGLPNRPGTNTEDAYLDGFHNGEPDGVLEPIDDCVDMRFGLCPNPLAGGLSFFAQPGGPGCYVDCNADAAVDFFDFLCFVNDFNSMGVYSECNGDHAHDLFDFLCFVSEFNNGC